jgi:hypothetical protein
LRYGDWKATFLIQRAEGMHVWLEPFTELRAPILTNLRMDPFELASEHGMDYDRWFLEHMFMIAPAAAICREGLADSPRFPAPAAARQLQPRQRHAEHHVGHPALIAQAANPGPGSSLAGLAPCRTTPGQSAA